MPKPKKTVSETIRIKKSEEANQIIEMFQQAFKKPEVPKLYANGFVNAHGSGDVVILLQQNTQTVAVLNISFTMAKTLALKLADTIKGIEDASGNTIMTTDDIDRALKPLVEELPGVDG